VVSGAPNSLGTYALARTCCKLVCHLQSALFHSWLGKNSTTNKNLRLIRELKVCRPHASVSSHARSPDVSCGSCGEQSIMSLYTSGGPNAMVMDYLPLMRLRLLKPLIDEKQDGIPEVTQLLNDYGLTREDWASITSVVTGKWSSLDVTSLESTVKGALTREYVEHSISRFVITLICRLPVYLRLFCGCRFKKSAAPLHVARGAALKAARGRGKGAAKADDGLHLRCVSLSLAGVSIAEGCAFLFMSRRGRGGGRDGSPSVDGCG
jgi:hypothetical protein